MARRNQKPVKQNLSRSEQKAAAIDVSVRAQIAAARAAQNAKTLHLRALREAHEASQASSGREREDM
jgi:hypothetical protein